MASSIKCPSCGGIFSEEAYKKHTCSSKTLGGESDLRKSKYGEAVGGDGSN